MKYILIFCLLTLISINTQASPQGFIFTYQGELIENNSPANGNYAMTVSLYTDAVNGTHIQGLSFLTVPVIDGIFTLDLDFGDTPFMGEENWLELAVANSSSPNFTTMSPRQLVTNAPYAIHSQFVGTDGVDTLSIQNSAIISTKIAAGAVTESKLGVGSVTNSKIANNAIGTLNIINETITAVDIADNTITNTQLAINSITHTEIGTSAVRSDEILNGTIVAADVNTSSIQQRVSGTCAAGSSIASILADGTVTCETDDSGSSGWGLTGNAGTTPGTNFIGTTDNKALEFKVNNLNALRIEPASGSTLINITTGPLTNTMLSGSFSSSILAGNNNSVNGANSTIGGGERNMIVSDKSMIGSGIDNIIKSDISFIGGGDNNEIETSGKGSFIGGGANNTAYGFHSSILGFDNTTHGLLSIAIGANNDAGADYSLALGRVATTRSATQVGSGTTGDEHSFVWSQTGLSTTGSHQVLFEAMGGFGIGTNTPLAPLHVKGQGTSFSTLTDQVVGVFEPNSSSDNVSLAINKLDASKESALVFSASQKPEFDIRTTNGGFLTISNYDNMGASKLMMRIGPSTVNRIDIFANLEPEVNNFFDFGSASYRWKTLYTTNIDSTNAVNVTSDKRLKDNINDIEYGLSEVLAMRPVSYSMKNSEVKNIHLGLIAQEVEQVVPEIVSQKDDEARTRSMRYGELIPVLIKATQEQQTLIDQQNIQIKALQDTVNQLIKSNQ